MNRKDKQTLDVLKKEFASLAENAKIPEKLSKQNVVGLIENNNSDFSDKTGLIIDLNNAKNTKKAKTYSAIRRTAGVAAMLFITIVCIVFLNSSSRVTIIESDPVSNKYNADNMVKYASSYEEVEKAVQEILNSPVVSPEKPTSSQKGEQTPSTSVNGSSPQTQKPAVSPLPSTVVNAVERLTDYDADIIKTDGKYLYIVASGKNAQTGRSVEQIKILKAVPADSMGIVSTVVLDDGTSSSGGENCIEICLKNNILIAVTSCKANSVAENSVYEKKTTVARFYDISDPSNAKLINCIEQDGTYITSKFLGNSFCLITSSSITSSPGTAIPSFRVNSGASVYPETSKIYFAANSPEAQYIFITATNFSDFSAPVACSAFVGSNGNMFYSSGNALFVARQYLSDQNLVMTEIYRFSVTGNSVALNGSALVEGSLASELSVDKTTNCIRLVATNKDSSSLYIFSSDMQMLGNYSGLFPGEKIKSVKFIENECYIVAGETADTTMILDLSDPVQPKKLDTVSVNGFSDASLLLNETTLLKVSISKDTEPSKIVISLYDLSNPANVTSIDTFEFFGEFDASLFSDIRSIMYSPENEIIGIPIVSYDKETGTGVSSYALLSFSNGQISFVNKFDHNLDYSEDAATRSTLIDDILYTISGEKVVAFSISEGKYLTSIILK